MPILYYAQQLYAFAILGFALIDHPPSPPRYPRIEGPQNRPWF